MAARIRAADWSATPLGDPLTWPAALKTALGIVLGSRHAMMVFWGPELLQFYNDAMSSALALDGHPPAWGQGARAYWKDAWHRIGPEVEQVLAGRAARQQDTPPVRSRVTGDFWTTCSHSPIRDAQGVHGVLTVGLDPEQRHHAQAQQVQDLQQMHEMTSALFVSGSLEEQLDLVLRTAAAFLGAGQGVISMFDAEAGGLVTKASMGLSADGLRQIACVAIGDGACGLAFAQGRSIVVQDTEADPAYLAYRPLARQEDFRCVLSSPFHDATGASSGVLSLYSRHPRCLDEREMRLVEICAGHIGLCAQRARAEALRSESERALAKSQSRLEQLANTIPQLAWMANADGWIHWYNNRWYDYTGTTPDQMEGWGWQSVHDPEVLPLVMERWPDSIKTGQPFQMTFPLKGKDGRFRPFFTLVSPLRDESGKVVQWFGSNTDVSPLQDAEQALRKSEQRLQQGLAAGRMAVWDWDIQTDRLVFSSNASAILGREPATMQAFFDLIEPAELTRLRAAMARVIGQGGDFQELLRTTRPEAGDAIWLDVRGQMSAGASSSASMQGIYVDVTQRVLAEEQLRQAAQRKDEFLAMLAHELRNPLAPISSAAAILRRSEVPPEKVRALSDIIGRQVTHMTNLVDDLLDVSRVTRGLVTLEKALVDLRSVIHSAAEQVGPLIDSRAHALTLELGSEAAQVQGDRTRLIQVVANILNNAAKYTAPGGAIAVTLQVRGEEAALSVRDNGPGIEAELLPRVFELFAQGERTPDRAQGGLGLGLALVRSMVELHGGRVDVDSAGRGQGSCFTVHLPLVVAPKEDSPLAEASKPAESAVERLKLLVVDDNVDAALTLAALLGAAGHEVDVAHNAAGALERAASGAHDAFILDIGLPEVDGYELARRLRARPNHGGVLIALTGYGQEHDRALSARAGFHHHLVKPIRGGELELVLCCIGTRGDANGAPAPGA